MKNDENFTKNFLTDLIKTGINQKYFRSEIDAELQVYLLGKQLSFLREPEVFSQIAYPIETVVETIINNFLMAICTEKGIKEIEKQSNAK